MRIEVFKTNVKEADRARCLLELLHGEFGEYTANFDLDDCDRILRVVSKSDVIDTLLLIDFLRRSGVDAQVLADDIPETMQA